MVCVCFQAGNEWGIVIRGHANFPIVGFDNRARLHQICLQRRDRL